MSQIYGDPNLNFTYLLARELLKRNCDISEQLRNTYSIGIAIEAYLRGQREHKELIAISKANHQNSIVQDHRYKERVRGIRSKDEMTGLLNKTGFAAQLEEATARAKRRVNPREYLLNIDINQFKRVNDVFGHEEGDKMIITTANHLAQHLPVVGHVGGDEFLALLPRSTYGDSLEDYLHNIITSYECLPDVLRINAPSTGNDYTTRVTLSIGAQHLSKHITTSQAMNKADALMYRAKRNRKANKGQGYFISS
jgi:diguanylate cyclase (GGDEF)-like protein